MISSSFARRGVKLRLASFTFVACALIAHAIAQPNPVATDPPDPVEGKWFGVAGFAQDRVELGLEFVRDAKHELKANLYAPVTNFYGFELPGVWKRSDAKYVLDTHAITLALHGDKLEGTYMPLNAPITLQRTNELPVEAPVPDFPLGPGPKWQTKLGGAIYAPAALHGGIAYVGTAGGLFYAVRTKDGSFVWAFTAGRPIHGEALATDDAIFFVCDDGYLRKLEHGGKEIWRYDLGDARTPRVLVHQILPDDPANDFDFDTKAPRPLLVDGTLYVGSGDGGFHAVDAASGRRVWRFESKDKIRADAASFGELVIFGSFDHHVYALDRATGKEVWNRDVGAKLSSAPAIVGDAVVTGNRGGLLAALDAATGKTRWRMFFWGSSVESDAVPYGDLFYIGSSDMRRVSCIDPTDGQVAWRADVYGCAWSRVAVTEKNVYVGAFGVKPYLLRHLGGVTAVDRASGKVAWRWPMPEWPGSLVNGFAAGPAVDHDVLVIGGLDGCLYAFALA